MWTDADLGDGCGSGAGMKKLGPPVNLPIPTDLLLKALESDSEDSDDNEDRLDADVDGRHGNRKICRDANADLDRWERASRVWLSTGTVFILLILLQAMHLRQDIRNLAATTNEQLYQVCSVVDDKSQSLQKALALTSASLHPLAASMLQEVATRVRGAVLFTVQVLGSKVGELLKSLCKEKICIFYGILVGLEHFLDDPSDKEAAKVEPDPWANNTGDADPYADYDFAPIPLERGKRYAKVKKLPRKETPKAMDCPVPAEPKLAVSDLIDNSVQSVEHTLKASASWKGAVNSVTLGAVSKIASYADSITSSLTGRPSRLNAEEKRVMTLIEDTHFTAAKVQAINAGKEALSALESVGSIVKAGMYFAGDAVAGLAGPTFLKTLKSALRDFIRWTVRFLERPEELFMGTVRRLISEALDFEFGFQIGIDPPTEQLLCSHLKQVDFGPVERSMRIYLQWLMVVLVGLLVAFNFIQFVNAVEKGDKEAKGSVNGTEGVDAKSTAKPKPPGPRWIRWLLFWFPKGPLRQSVHWFLLFMSYPQFWMYLGFGLIGVLHLHFHREVEEQLKIIREQEIAPLLRAWSKMGRKHLLQVFHSVHLQWCELIRQFTEPFMRFFALLRENFGGLIASFVWVLENLAGLYERLGTLLEFDLIFSQSAKIIRGIVDCYFMKKVRSWGRMLAVLNDMFVARNGAGDLALSFTGLSRLFKSTLHSMLRFLQLNKAVRKLFSFSFKMFLGLLRQRSGFLYVYLIVCAILLVQGLMMALIRLWIF
jgi:hypothetical protein